MAQENLTNSQATAPKVKMTYQITGVFDLISKAFEVYKGKFWKFIGIMMIPVLGALPTVIVVGLFVGLNYLSMDSGAVLTFVRVILIILGLIGVVIFAVVSISAQAGLYILIKTDKEISVKEAFLQGKSMAWQFFVVNLLVGVFVLLWSLLLVIPGIIIAIYYSFATWILVDKGDRGINAIKKSKKLIRGYWWAVFGRLLAIQVILMIVNVLPLIIFGGTDNQGSKSLLTIVSNLISFLAAPLVLVYAYSIYKDLLNIKGENSIPSKNRI